MKLEINKGDEYGCWTIVKETEKKGYHRYIICKCKCGKEKSVRLGDLRNGASKSCGCLINRKINVMSKSGNRICKSKTRIYRIWRGIKIRCDNKKSSSYKYYGGRGITYDPKWEIFEGFYEDMKDGYSDELSIDRIKNHLGYSKENCRWATIEEQARNKRNSIFYKGKSIAERAEALCINRSVINNRRYRGWDIEKAIFTPIA